MSRRRALLLAALIVGIDAASKALVVAYGAALPLSIGPVAITPFRNEGIILGLFAGEPTLIAFLVAGALIGLLAALIVMRPSGHLRLALALLLGGALGNGLDRLASGGVLDFVTLGIGDLRLPTFNFADASLTLAVALLALDFVRPATERS